MIHKNETNNIHFHNNIYEHQLSSLNHVPHYPHT